ncbi:MAG: hypothetical protein IPO14_01490 [Saprospiraceae bacterium]|nr:hypothetical protein [Saprospiraceae bacterium]
MNFDHIIQQKLNSFETTDAQAFGGAESKAFEGLGGSASDQNHMAFDNTAGMNFDFFSDKLNNAFGEKSFDTSISDNISNFNGGNIGLDFSKVENHLQNFDSISNFDQAIVASVSNFTSADLSGMNFDNFNFDLSKAENTKEFDGRVHEAVVNTTIYTDGLDYDSFEYKWKYSEFDQICRQRLNFYTPEIVSGIDFDRVSNSLDDQKVQKFDHLVVDALSGLSINSKGDFDSFENKLQDSSEIKIQAFDYLIDQKVGDFVPTIEEKNFDAFYARLNSTIKNNSQAFDNAVKSNIESKLDKTIGRSWDGMEKVIQLEKSRRFKILAVKLVEAAVFLLAIFTYLNYQPTIGKWQKKNVTTIQRTVDKQVSADNQKSIIVDKKNSNDNQALSQSSQNVDDMASSRAKVSSPSAIKSDINNNALEKGLSLQGQNSLSETKSSPKAPESAEAKITGRTDVNPTNISSSILSSKVKGNNTKTHITPNSIDEEKGVTAITNTNKESIGAGKSNKSKADATTLASNKAVSPSNSKAKESGIVSLGNSKTNSNTSSSSMTSTNQGAKNSLDASAKTDLDKKDDNQVSNGNSSELLANQSNLVTGENLNEDIDGSAASSLTIQKSATATAASKASVLTMLDKKVLAELFVSNNADRQLNNLKLPSRKNIVSTLNGNKKISGQSPTGLVYYAEVFGGGNTLIIPPPNASVNDANLVKSLIGHQFGIKLGAQKNNFNVESGIQYSINKLNEKRIKLNFESINIPISAGYTINVNDRIKINVLAELVSILLLGVSLIEI